MPFVFITSPGTILPASTRTPEQGIEWALDRADTLQAEASKGDTENDTHILALVYQNLKTGEAGQVLSTKYAELAKRAFGTDRRVYVEKFLREEDRAGLNRLISELSARVAALEARKPSDGAGASDEVVEALVARLDGQAETIATLADEVKRAAAQSSAPRWPSIPDGEMTIPEFNTGTPMAYSFAKGLGDNEVSYPLDAAQIRKFEDIGFVCPQVGKRHGINLPHALCNPAAMDAALEEVIAVRKQVVDGVFPRAFMEKYYPSDWGDFPKEIPEPLARAHETFALPAPLSFDDPAGLARVVHMDNPIDLGRLMLGWLIGRGYAPKGASNKGYDFLSIVPGAMDDMAGYVSKALSVAFEIKYFYGIARPEELSDQGAAMTAYREGAPAHPSFPAGHGYAAFASARYFFAKWELPDDVQKVLFDSAYIWAMARTLAGVHYAVDNLTHTPRKSEV